jgi:hypothetical protein
LFQNYFPTYGPQRQLLLLLLLLLYYQLTQKQLC